MDTVFHVAAKPGVWGPYSDFYETNVMGTENIISACQKYKISELIYTSSPSVIFDGNDMEGVDETVPYPHRYHAAYPKTKAIAEKKVLKAAQKGLKTIILRPHLIWGPGDNHLVPRIIERSNKLAIIGTGKNTVDTIYIDNAAYAHILAYEQLSKKPELSGNIYFISQDDPIFVWDMVNAILKAAHKKPITKHIPRSIALIMATLFEFTYKLLHIKKEPRLTRFVVKELSSSHWFNISRVKKDLGYKPIVSADEGLKRLERWLGEAKT
jgi:nucleoside-diphosphate-sugar epimerase